MSPAAVPHDLSQMVESLSTISDHLVASYAALSQRAQHVENELVAANEKLEEKVAELDALRGHLEAILSALPTGVVVRDGDGRIVRVNPAVGAILGTSDRELIGERTHPHLCGAKADGASRELARADGQRAVVATRWSPVYGARGESLGSVEILDDRTELAKLTERLHDLDKMAALGNMAGGIAHEIRNPMNAIGGFAELLRREFEPATRQHRFATRIREGIVEIDAIIANVLSFANPDRLCLETVDAKELVLDAIRSARRSLPDGAPHDRWQITHDVHARPFQADRIKVRQALRNLVANALQAQPTAGASKSGS
jgi:nitrogen fixation/metabolism regulation signal transduction histidine kinase